MTRIEALEQALSALKYCANEHGLEAHKATNEQAHEQIETILDEHYAADEAEQGG